MNLTKITESLRGCECGKVHDTGFGTLLIEENAIFKTAEALKDTGFKKKLHVVYDKNTLGVSAGLLEILRSGGYKLSETGFENLTNASLEAARTVMSDMKREGADAVLSIGTGSLNDICRYASVKFNTPFAVFATAPSMDGFASVVSPITVNGFKQTLEGKCPELIVADTTIMAKAPKTLKSAGLGDLLGKYTAHADWEISRITAGEYYCEKVADLTRKAVDSAVFLAESGDDESPAYAGALMEALILSGIAMKLAGCTRPASGAEHHLSHFWEAKYLQMGLPPVFHGTKVGIATAIVAGIYNDLSKIERVREARKILDEDELKGVFGSLWSEMRGENFPNPLDTIPEGVVSVKWDEIRTVLARVPKAEKIRELLRKTGGPATCAEANISPELEVQGRRYGKYVRFRITMMRILDMIEW